MSPATREVLIRFDEPGAYEIPAKFDYADLERRAKLVYADVEAAGVHVSFEGAAYNQDASFSIAILLHPYERAEGGMLSRPTIRFSNFGSLATIGWREYLPEKVLGAILASISHRGFIYVSADELDCEYDGVMPEKHVFHTWWTRYFDWL